MEIGSVRTPVTGVTQPVPRAPAESEQSVRTDTPVRAAVSEAAKKESQALLGKSASSDDTSSGTDAVQVAISKAGNRKKDAPTPQREVERDYQLDPQTRSLVYKKIDIQSGDVVQQVPEESLLRMRQMIQAWGEGGGGAAKTGHTAAYDVTA